jgi:anti-sigma regulatory factor (Ser/Thr protein kinase)
MRTLRHARPGGRAGLHQGFPSSAECVLPATADSVPRARHFVTGTLAGWGLSHVTGSTVQVIAELAANAVRASERSVQPQILVCLVRGPGVVFVQVGDHSRHAPPRPHPRVRCRKRRDAEHGRGLLIAEAFSARLAWYRGAGGWKIVWAAIPVPDPVTIVNDRQRWGRAA